MGRTQTDLVRWRRAPHLFIIGIICLNLSAKTLGQVQQGGRAAELRRVQTPDANGQLVGDNLGAPGPRAQRRQLEPAGAKMVTFDKSGRPIQLVPGLLDETLLTSGSFAFGARLVKFDRLRVLGNVYVNHVNGRPLRESYLFKTTTGGQAGPVQGGHAGARGRLVAPDATNAKPASRDHQMRLVLIS